MSYNPTDIYTTLDLKKITVSNEINADIIVRGENIKTLEGVHKIDGLLGLSDSSIQSLGSLKEVKGNFFISTNTVYSNIKSLNQLENVGGDLILRYSNVEDLGALKKVTGKLSLRDTNIESLGVLEYVGGDLFLPKRIQKTVDLSGVTVVGKIRFWNDSKTREKVIPKSEMGFNDFEESVPHWRHSYVYSYSEIREAKADQLRFYKIYKSAFLKGKYIDIKGNDNYSFILFYDLVENHNSDIKKLQSHLQKLAQYYPKTKSYGQSEIIKKLERSDDFEKAWQIVMQKEYVNVQTIIEYEDKLKKELLDGNLIVQLGGYSHLTEFGQNNIEHIKPYTTKQLELYKLEKKTKFFDLFVYEGEPIKTKTAAPDYPKTSILNFIRKKSPEATKEYSSEYYKPFFLSESEYDHYKAIDDSQAKSGYKNSFPHVVEKAIFNQCRLILKQAEDVYREAIGMPKVGEGWISETELFYKISEHFKDEEVLHHASPKWLGRQHLDIYFPKLKIGIEYQGAQHYEPIEFFGGQEAFEKTVERDERKSQLCEKHNCSLIYVDKGYDFNEVVEQINIKRSSFEHL